MNIILFTINDSEYIPNLLEPLLIERGLEIKHIFISKTFLSPRKIFKNLKFFFLNNYPFCISKKDLISFLIKKIRFTFAKCFSKNPKYNLRKFLKSKKINYSFVDKVNESKFLEELKNLNPDIVLFAVFDKIVKNKFIDIAKLGTFNLHLGPLPSYKGGLSSFWVLRYQEQFTGSSIHKVIEKIDEGELIDEIKFPITTNSMYELMKIKIYLTSIMLPKTVANIISQNYQIIDTSKRKSNYFVFPSKKDFKNFYKNGCKLI